VFETLRSAARQLRGGRGADEPDANDPLRLRDRVEECFSETRRGWSNRDLTALTPYLSDRFADEISVEVDELDRSFQVNYVEDLELLEAAIQRPEPSADRFDVHLAFRARDWLEDLRDSTVISGDRVEPTTFEQRWAFVRAARKGWVVDAVEPYDASARPAGWYATADEPTRWRLWDGAAWADRDDQPSAPGEPSLPGAPSAPGAPARPSAPS